MTISQFINIRYKKFKIFKFMSISLVVVECWKRMFGCTRLRIPCLRSKPHSSSKVSHARRPLITKLPCLFSSSMNRSCRKSTVGRMTYERASHCSALNKERKTGHFYYLNLRRTVFNVVVH